MCLVEKVLRTAPEAFLYLRGFICVHKPADWSIKRLAESIQGALAKDLNAMDQGPIPERVEIAGSIKDGSFSVAKVPSIAYHPLVQGPRYQPGHVAVHWISRPVYKASGLCVLALRPNRVDFALRTLPMVSTYHLVCELGKSTDDGTTSGRVVDKSRYHHVHQALVERYLSSVQASFQRRAFESAGVDPQSQEAFELASRGPVRPLAQSQPVVYALRCLDFDPPSFTLELQIINETDVFLRQLVLDLSLKLRTTAVVSKMRRIRFGFFTLDHALIKNHWSLENILDNIQETAPYIEQWRYPNLLGGVDSSKENLTLLERI